MPEANPQTWLDTCVALYSTPALIPCPTHPGALSLSKRWTLLSSKEMSLILQKPDPSQNYVTIPQSSKRIVKRWSYVEKIPWNEISLTQPSQPFILNPAVTCPVSASCTVPYFSIKLFATWPEPPCTPLPSPTILAYRSFLDIRNNHHSPPDSSSLYPQPCIMSLSQWLFSMFSVCPKAVKFESAQQETLCQSQFMWSKDDWHLCDLRLVDIFNFGHPNTGPFFQVLTMYWSL